MIIIIIYVLVKLVKMIIKIYEQCFNVSQKIFTFIFFDVKNNITYYINQFEENNIIRYNSFKIDNINETIYDNYYKLPFININCNLLKNDPLKFIKEKRLFENLLNNKNEKFDKKEILNLNTLKYLSSFIK